MKADDLDAEIRRRHEEACAEGKDFYVDPKSGLLVTTRAAHLKRGACCESGCRHCPYGFKKPDGGLR